MKVTILGSGTCVPSLARASSAILVEEEDTRLLVDCGLGVMHRLLAAGCEPKDLDGIFLTHFHPDHVAELVSLLFSGKYSGSRGRSKPLTLMGGKGLGTFHAGLLHAFGEWIDLGEGLILEEFPMTPFRKYSFRNITLESFPVRHKEESLALSVQVHGKKTVVSGDTDFCPELADFASGAGLFICECSMPDGMKVPGHLTPSLAGEMAQAAKVGHLVLTHFYPPCDGADILGQASRRFTGKITLAEDLMSFDV